MDNLHCKQYLTELFPLLDKLLLVDCQNNDCTGGREEKY